MRALVQRIRAPGGRLATIFTAAAIAIAIGLTPGQRVLHASEGNLTSLPKGQVCTYSEIKDGDETTGTLYSVDDGCGVRKRSDISMKFGKTNHQVELHLIIDSGIASIWGSTDSGIITLVDDKSVAELQGFARSTCKDWQPNDSVFKRPANVTFTNTEILRTSDPRKYVALGDSYSSGEGAIFYSWDRRVLDAAGQPISFLEDTDTCENRCHRAAADKWSDSGARLLESGETITRSLCDQQCATLCSPQTITLPGLAAPGGLFEQIHKRAPKAAIRVLLYPHLFENIPEEATCNVGVAGIVVLTGKKTKTMNKVACRLNTIIREAIAEAKTAGMNIVAVDPNSVFEGHRLCNTGNGVRPSPRGSHPDFDSKDAWIHGVILEKFLSASGFSFHPNAVGHEKFAQLIIETLR